VISVEFLTEIKDTCDLTISKYHNFATNAGVIIHNSKATLAAEDVRFARTIERFQKIVVAELEKIAIVHLYTQGFDDAELLNFDLKLTNPSMIHEQEKLELLNQQVDIAQSAMETKLFSRDWIYNNIFEMDDHQKKDIFEKIIEDQKQAFRMEQIATEGNDPAQSGEKAEAEESVGEWGGSEKEPQYSHLDYGEATSQDIKDATKYERDRQGKREFKGGSPLYPGKGSTIVRAEGLLAQLRQKFGKDINQNGLLNENSLLDDEDNE
jgi:hypothetical protein